MRRTRASSALRIATPPSAAAGRASTSSAFASSIASSDPIRDRWTGWTAVTIPTEGSPIAARSRISPPTYMPISSTAAPCSGPRRRTVSGRPTSLFWLPSVRSVANRRSSTPATASLVEVLAMLPVIPTTSGSNRRRHAAATACSARSGSATRTIVTSPSAVVRRLAGRAVRVPPDDQGRGARGDRVGEEPCAVGALAGEGDEQVVPLDEPGVDGGAADRAVTRAHERAPTGRDHELGRRSGLAVRGRSRARVSHTPRSRAGAAERGSTRRPGRGTAS